MGTLRQALDTDELVYFPEEYSSNHRGQTKLEAGNNGRVCAVAGWSVGLVESYPIMPQQGSGKTLGGRKQLETGASPREYLQTLQTQAYLEEPTARYYASCIKIYAIYSLMLDTTFCKIKID